MNADSFLSSAVEVEIGLAGFAGIVAAIRHRHLNSWAAQDRLLLRILLVASAMSVVFAWLPALLSEAGINAPTLWQISSLVLFVWQISAWVYRGQQARDLHLDRVLPKLAIIWNAAFLLLQLANLYLGLPWPFLLGVANILANALIVFLVLLLGENADNGT